MLASGASFGANWIYIGSDSTDSKFYIDYDYYKYSKTINTVDLWYRVDSESNGKSYTSQKTLTRYDCNNKKYKDLSRVNYFSSGIVSDTYEHHPSLSEYRVVFPDTMGEVLWGVACGTPSKGLDFKYKEIGDFDNFNEYMRAQYAYLRERPPQEKNDLIKNFTPSVKIENYYDDNNKIDFDRYNQDKDDALKKLRDQNIKKQYK